MLRLCVTAFWVALVAWLAALVAAAATAIAAFGSLPELGVVVPDAGEVYPGGSAEAGRFAAGFVAQPVFDGAATVLWFAVPVAAGSAILLRSVFRWPGRGWVERIRVAFLFAAVVLSLLHVAILAPRMRTALADYRGAVFQGDATSAAAHKALFDADHRRADPLLRTTSGLLAVVLVLSAFSFAPRRADGGDRGRSWNLGRA
jgi:hypothetical protein